MKQTYLVLTSLIFLQVSCSKDTIDVEETTTNETTEIFYKGLPVNHRFEVSLNELEAEHPDQLASSNSSLLVSGEDIFNVSTEEIIKANEEISEDFPFYKPESENNIDELIAEKLDQERYEPYVREELIKLGYLRDVDKLIEEVVEAANAEVEKSEEENLKMIKADFSKLTEKEIAENIETINEYYLKNHEICLKKKLSSKSDLLSSSASKTQTSKTTSDVYDKTVKFSCIYVYLRTYIPNYYSTGYLAVVNAASIAKSASEAAFTTAEGGPSNTREDAYRHVLWNALLANDYANFISWGSKVNCVNFAEYVADTNELCADNPVDGKQMDYHNNRIGRELWADMTTYRKVFWATIGLNRPSTSALKSAVFDYVQNESCFIPKAKTGVFPNNKLLRSRTAQEVSESIDATHDDTIVYFNGSIAQPDPVPSDCEENGTTVINVYVPGTNIIQDIIEIIRFDCRTEYKCYNTIIL